LLGYWVAFMANASFDVFIEGPMGGIWFWTIYGVGLAAMWCFSYRPHVLSNAALSATTVATPVDRRFAGFNGHRAEA
jgi:hypothetical protein